MNTKFAFSALFSLCLIILAICFYFNKETIIENENRFVTEFPALPKKLSTSKIKHFFSELSMFYNDNFPLRKEIIKLTTQLLPDLTLKNKFIAFKGKNNWIFLGNNYAKTIDKLTGKFFYYQTDNEIYSVNKRYNFYHSIAQTILKQNNKLIFLIAPNKTTIYPEYLPATIIPAQQPFHHQLTKKMQKAGFEISYPRQRLLNAKSKRITYYLNDTHWNQYGAFIAFIDIIHSYFADISPFLKENDFLFETIPSHRGDLNLIGNFPYNGENNNDTYNVLYKNTPLSFSDKLPPVNNTEYCRLINKNALFDKNIWLIGDSFSGALLPYFCHTFKTVHYTSRSKFTTKRPPLVSNADLVIYECVEREF